MHKGVVVTVIEFHVDPERNHLNDGVKNLVTNCLSKSFLFHRTFFLDKQTLFPNSQLGVKTKIKAFGAASGFDFKQSH